MTGGGSYRAEVNAEAAFERLGRELAGYYRIGVEKDPSDLESKPRRMKVQVSRSGVNVRARDVFDVRTYEDRDWAARIASALDSPVPATGVGLRITSYLAPDPEDRSRLRIVLSGEATRIEPGETTFQVVVRNLDGTKILAGDQPLREATANGLQFATHMGVAPGQYIVRVAVMDSTGRVGSVEHRVDARRVPVGVLSGTGPVLVRVPSRVGAVPQLALDRVGQDERLALEISLDGDLSQVGGADVVFEIAKSADSPALVNAMASLSREPQGSLLAHAVADMRVLPPGDYIARARVKAGSETIGQLLRPFAVTGGVVTTVAADTTTTGGTTVVRRAVPPPLSARAVGAVQPFATDHVLTPQVLGGFLDQVAARPDAASPMIKELVNRARTSGVADLYVSDTLAAESPVAAFLRGLSLFSQKKFDPAANAFRSAMRGSPDFYPAMVYLGACYAAGGKDKEAAGAWHTALIKEGDSAPLYKLLSDALLRQGNGALALQTVERARTKWPDDDGLKRRYVVAALLGGKPAEGLQVLDTIQQNDESTIALAVLVLYEAFVNERPVQTADEDRARMLRLADDYRASGGPSLALVETWVSAATRK
jgi:tetratricopeptide (TPR) repeat protein